MFPLSSEEKERLKRLNQDKSVVEALKKLFLSECLKGAMPERMETLAAERIAIDIVKSAFHALNAIQPDSRTGRPEENLV